MAFKLGSISVDNLKLGSTQVSKAYLGSTLIWQYVSPTPTVNPTLTVTPIPSNATVSISGNGQTISGAGQQSLQAPAGTTMTVNVQASGYTSKSTTVVLHSDTEMTVSLDVSMATITFTTNAPNPTIVLTAAGYTQSGNSITVPVGTRVDYTISATGYVTRSNSIFADTDKTYDIILNSDSNLVTLTIAPTPSSTSVSISATGYDTVSGQGTQSITVVKDTPVTYTVTYANQTLSVDSVNPLYVSNDMLIEYDMTKTHVRQTITYNNQTTPAEHLIGTFIYKSSEGTMVVGPTDASRATPLFFPKGEQIYLTFHTNNCSHTSGNTGTYSTNGGTSYSLRINKILTVNYTPTDAIVEVVDGAGNTVMPITESAGRNTYYFPYYNSGSTQLYSNTCTITVSRAGYTTKSTTAIRNYSQDGSVTINL